MSCRSRTVPASDARTVPTRCSGHFASAPYLSTRYRDQARRTSGYGSRQERSARALQPYDGTRAGTALLEIAGEDGRALWKTRRLLQDDEIVEVVHGLSELAGSSHYSIHQPKTGWYLAIKTNDKAFCAAQQYVSLAPNCTNPQEFKFKLRSATPSTKPTSDDSSGAEQLSSTSFTIKPATETQAGRKRLSLRAITETFASKRNSFSIFVDETLGQDRSLLHFEDHPSLLHTDTKGVLSLDQAAITDLNADSTFFVAIAIAYLGFLEDQEAYKAASDG